MMKFLFKLIFYPIFTLIILVLILLFMLYKKAVVPVQDYDPANAVQTEIKAVLLSSLDDFIADEDRLFDLSLTEAETNLIIRTELLKALNKQDEDFKYVLKEDSYLFQGVWTDYKADVIRFYAGFQGKFLGITYKTRLLIDFKIEVNAGDVTLKMTKINIGKMPFAWAPGFAQWLLKTISGSDINKTINDQIKDYGTFNLKDKKLTLHLKDLVAKQLANNAQAGAFEFFIDYVFDNNVIDIATTSNSFGLQIDLKVFEDNQTLNVVNNPFLVQAEYDTFLLTKMIAGYDGSQIEFDETDINRVLDFNIPGSATNHQHITTIDFLDDYKVDIFKPLLVLENNSAQAHIGIQLYNASNPSVKFQTIFKVDITFETSDDDLIVAIGDISIGDLDLSAEAKASLLATLEAFITNEQIVVEDFFTQLPPGVNVDQVLVENHKLVIKLA